MLRRATTHRAETRIKAAEQLREIQQLSSRAVDLSSFFKQWSEANSRFIRAVAEMKQANATMTQLVQQRAFLKPTENSSAPTSSSAPALPPGLSPGSPPLAVLGTSPEATEEYAKHMARLFDNFVPMTQALQASLDEICQPLASFSEVIQTDLCTRLSLVEDGEKAFNKVFHSLDKAERRVQDCAQKGASAYQKLIELEAERDQLLDTVSATGQVILTSSGIALEYCTRHLGGHLSRFLIGLHVANLSTSASFSMVDGMSFWSSLNQLSIEELLHKSSVINLATNALQNPQTPLKLLKILQRESKRESKWSRMKRDTTTTRPVRSAVSIGNRARSANPESTPSSSSSSSSFPSSSSLASSPSTSSTAEISSIADSSDESEDDERSNDEDVDDDEEDQGDLQTEPGVAMPLLAGGERVPREGLWTFEVEKVCRRRLKRKTLMVDAASNEITLYDVTAQTRRVLPGHRLISVRRSNVNPRKIKLFWLNRVTPERFLFYTRERVERFYEAHWALMGPNPSQLTKQLTIFIGTWNLGNAPAPDDLSPWLSSMPECDIYVITVQECEFSPRGGQSNEEDWFGQLVRHFGERYYRLVGVSLLHIRTIVMVRREHYPFVSNMKKATEATGIANVIGNKGGTGIFFSIYGTRLCFIGAHLAAHLERISDRNANYRDIIKGLSGLAVDDWELTTYPHHLFFAGDLNYRIDLPREEAIRLIDQKKWFQLLIYDQLLSQIEKAAAFPGFSEGLLTFPPTYRYNRGDRTYSTEKMRVPAWCDRVLWKSLPGCHIEQISYSCCDHITTSDHSPVSAVFKITAPLPNPKPPSKDTALLSPQRLSIRFLSFRAQLSARNTRVEPYLYIVGHFLEAAVTSNSVSQSITPNWNPDGIPSLIPIINDLDFLRRQHLFISVRDRNGDPWGQCAISLAELCNPENVTATANFKSLIWRNGLSAGEISGSFTFGQMPAITQGVSSRPIRKEGYLLKEGGFRKNWKRRWFVLTSAGHLEYYDNETVTKPISAFSISGRIIHVDPEAGKANCIAIEIPKRSFHVCTDSPEDLEQWLQAFLEFGNLPSTSESTTRQNTRTTDRSSHR